MGPDPVPRTPWPPHAEALGPLRRLVTDARARYEEQMLAHHFHLAPNDYHAE